MGNTIIALDILNASLTVATQIQAMLQKCASENRDLSNEELALLKTANDEREQKILNS